jgi:hypothetical protein
MRKLTSVTSRWASVYLHLILAAAPAAAAGACAQTAGQSEFRRCWYGSLEQAGKST